MPRAGNPRANQHVLEVGPISNPIAPGIAATAVAAAVMFAWIAIGSAFIGARNVDDDVGVPGAILIGSGITSFLLAAFCALGLVQTGVLVVSLGSAVVCIARYREALRIIRAAVQPYRGGLPNVPLVVVGSVIGVTMWAAAISPPRSADAMRYHLAHVKQIVQDGRWEAINDFHYALPFGWSLSYLPFEMLGLPQGAQILGLFLFAVFLSSAVRGLQRAGAERAAILAALVLMLHPASVRVFTEASADGYALFVVLTVALLLIRPWRLNSANVALLGFVSWIGLQSRYQLVAVAIAATICLVLTYRQDPSKHGAAMAYTGGSIAAIILASPFYVMNALSFGNPVWPLLIDPAEPGTTYNDVVAHEYSRSLQGTFAPDTIVDSMVTLFTKSFLFPLGIAIVAIILVAIFARGTGAKLLAVFGVIFFAEWFLMQPLLYPRFVLLMLPVAVLCGALVLKRSIEVRPRLQKPLYAAAITVALFFAVAVPYINRDSLTYAITADEKEFHRFTWFYRVYDWVNHNTPPNARFLVIVFSGQTYYLDRPHRRADPFVSGVVDWSRIDTGAELDSLLAAGGYSHVIYDNRDWNFYRGGTSTMNAVGEAYRSGLLRKTKVFEESLYTSRFMRQYKMSQVYVLERSRTINEPGPVFSPR